MNPETQQELFCRGCGWSTASLAGFAERLKAAGLLKRNAEPSREEVIELTAQLIDRLTCPDCHGRLWLEEVDDWPASQNCEVCGKPIPSERLEVFPDTTVCVACQQKAESGESDPAEMDFCPRCGSPMSLRSTSSGVTRYVMQCSSPSCRARV